MDKLNEFGDTLYKFIMSNYANPVFWLVIFIILLAVAFIYIGKLK